MTTWSDISKLAEVNTSDAQSTTSDKQNLQNIFKKAEIWGISPEILANASLSNLRAIVPLASKAIRDRDKDRLTELFTWAATMTNIKLRIALQSFGRELIPVQVENDPIFGANEPVYVIRLDQEQIRKIARTCQRQFVFTLDDTDILEISEQKTAQ